MRRIAKHHKRAIRAAGQGLARRIRCNGGYCIVAAAAMDHGQGAKRGRGDIEMIIARAQHDLNNFEPLIGDARRICGEDWRRVCPRVQREARGSHAKTRQVRLGQQARISGDAAGIKDREVVCLGGFIHRNHLACQCGIDFGRQDDARRQRPVWAIARAAPQVKRTIDRRQHLWLQRNAEHRLVGDDRRAIRQRDRHRHIPVAVVKRHGLRQRVKARIGAGGERLPIGCNRDCHRRGRRAGEREGIAVALARTNGGKIIGLGQQDVAAIIVDQTDFDLNSWCRVEGRTCRVRADRKGQFLAFDILVKAVIDCGQRHRLWHIPVCRGEDKRGLVNRVVSAYARGSERHRLARSGGVRERNADALTRLAFDKADRLGVVLHHGIRHVIVKHGDIDILQHARCGERAATQHAVADHDILGAFNHAILRGRDINGLPGVPICGREGQHHGRCLAPECAGADTRALSRARRDHLAFGILS